MPTLESLAPPPNVDMFGNIEERVDERGTLAKRFGIVPFSVQVTTSKNWQRRKNEWLTRLPIKSEEGRQSVAGANNICSDEWGRGAVSELYEPRKVDPVPGGGGKTSVRRLKASDAGRCFGQDIMRGEHVVGQNIAADKGYGFAAGENGGLSEKEQKALGVYAAPGGATLDRQGGGIAGTSIFDPVLCEAAYRWFAPPGGRVLDPFAGGSVRGIVANYLGFDYTGVDIRPEQIAANVRQGQETVDMLAQRGHTMQVPNWICGDSTNLLDVLSEADPFADDYDMIWTCPPYYNLEVYSEKENDGSQFETYGKFIAWYKEIFRQAGSRLKHNRFIGITIGDVRHDKEKLHSYFNLEVDTVRVMEELGYRHYNRMVLVTATGSLPVRIGAQFPRYRKVGNTHQMVYFFWKGDCDHKAILENLGELTGDDFKTAQEQE